MQPEYASLFDKADYLDEKMVEGTASLRQFLVSLLSFQPAWVNLLYRIRAALVAVFGIQREDRTSRVRLTPDQVPMISGEKLRFFTTRAARDNAFWFGEICNTHLNATLGVVVEPLPSQAEKKRFYIVTIVHYNNRIGPLYFTLIRPFHHLIIGRALRAAVA